MRDMELCRTMPGGVSPGTASAPAGSATALAAVVNLRRTRPRRMGPELRAGGRGERGVEGLGIGRGDVGADAVSRGRVLSTSRVRAGEGIAHPSSSRATAKTAPGTGRAARARPEGAARRDAGARAREPRRAAFAAPVRGSRPTDDASARTPRALLVRRVVHIDMVHDDACVRGNADRGRSVEWRGWCGSDASYALRSPAGAR